MTELRLESRELSAVVLPEHGAKLASLLHLPSGREWLVQPAGPLPPPVYGASFVDAEMCGWDEMLPTINACVSPDAGAPLPDHGEVWAVPWRVKRADSQAVTTSVEGRALPYRLRRTLELDGATLRVDYELSTDEPLSLLWAAHPQFACKPGTVVELDAPEALEVQPGPLRRVPWHAIGPTDMPHGTNRKLYVEGVERSELRDPGGTFLRISCALTIQRAKSSWRSCYNWTQAMAVLRIHFGDRIPDNT